MSSYDWSTHVPGPHEIETYTGKYVDLADPRPESIDLESVASGLANTCRYNGQVPFYSVAEHAVMVACRLSRQGYDPLIMLAGLHHDDSEAFLGDVTRPLKLLFQPTYANLTARMDSAIVLALRLPIAYHEFENAAVKAADNWALFIEADHLLPSKGRTWGGSGAAWEIGEDADRVTDSDLWLGGLTPDQAKRGWLAAHKYLMEQIDDIEDARRAIREFV